MVELTPRWYGSSILFLISALEVLLPPSALAVRMVNDPKGFEGIPWEATLVESAVFVPVGVGDRVQEYERKQGQPRLGEVNVESMRFVTIDGKFARVAVRYQGQKTHESVLTYLQSRFGPLDTTPGQIAGGLFQQFNWRGDETEINLTFVVDKERGLVFIESRKLAPRFTEDLGGQ